MISRINVDPATQIVYKKESDTNFEQANKFDYVVVVVDENTYAEAYNDSSNFTLPNPGPSFIQTVKCIVVLIFAHHVVIKPYVEKMDAVLAAWLPGTEGQCIADVLVTMD
ncbi:hypothetical protein MTR67_032827 [Solanum verrucosum]|uniref:Glycoside hydrolase family 3 C-terminal domain-containing protein n=1 Tax=Solanum verrucosum TaxID=315347 RepID=A0AAF0U4Y4_SOLVR|nr:hypothetical protein MTR67_032827 [Solanum verrucosum]